MKVRVFGTVIAVLLALSGCSPLDSSPRVPARTTGAEVPTAAPATFANRVWVVAESGQVAVGEIRVFLPEGTLVMASPHGRPALGVWSYRDGHLTITEEGLKYDVDILELNENTFRIRIHNPGEPVDIRFKPAGQAPVPKNPPKQSEGR